MRKVCHPSLGGVPQRFLSDLFLFFHFATAVFIELCNKFGNSEKKKQRLWSLRRYGIIGQEVFWGPKMREPSFFLCVRFFISSVFYIRRRHFYWSRKTKAKFELFFSGGTLQLASRWFQF